MKSLNRRIQGVTDYVAPLVGAWIEIFDIANMNVAEQSLLSWERGLKSLKYIEYGTYKGRSSRGSVD